MKNGLLVAIIAVLSGVLAWSLFFWEPRPEVTGVQVGGAPSLPPGGGFTLHSATGPVSLEDLHGKVVLLYFGYTWCPDICPTSLALMGQGLSRLDPAELEQVQGIFVSVDPERDTLDRLATYTDFFHPSIMGVTGSAEEVAQVATRYGAVYHKSAITSATEYVVDHTSATYVIDRDGALITVLAHGTLPDRIVEVVRAQLGKK